MKEKRRFGLIQRLRIYNRSRGKCQICGVKISPDNFHADHIVPWSKGGKTHVQNAQALCPSCNLSKSDSMTSAPPVSVRSSDYSSPDHFLPPGWHLREWQKEAIGKIMYSLITQCNKDPKDIIAFILHAFPGSGKSLVQCLAGKIMINDGYVDKIIFVVPSDVLRNQMEDDARQVGLHLSKKRIVDIHGDWSGIIVTYQQLGYADSSGNMQNAEAIRDICKNYRVMICGDEMHHIGTQKNWGFGFDRAFTDYACAKLLTSGTPFRSDGAAIPWVRYRDKKIDLSPPHAYSYGYGLSVWNSRLSALGDRVVRDVIIHPWDGEVCFTVKHKRRVEGGSSIEEGEETFSHRLSDNIDAIYPDIVNENGELVEDRSDLRRLIKKNRRLACLECGTPAHPYGTDYVKRQLIDANNKLNEVRQLHPWAGGLIVCMNIAHADAIARALEHWTGEKAVVVHQNTGKDKMLLGRFRKDKTKSRAKWLIAVRKVSEGVDIAHLRVGVYMTHIQAALSWIQMLGRVLRIEDILKGKDDWDLQTAHWYQYDDGVENRENEDGDIVSCSCNIKEYGETLMQERYITLEGGRETKTTEECPKCLQKPCICICRTCHQKPCVCPAPFTTVEANFATGECDSQVYQDERFENSALAIYDEVAVATGLPNVKIAVLMKQAGADAWERAAKSTKEHERSQDQKKTRGES